MQIRQAVPTDIPQIETLLYQVHKVHSDKRPDLFIPGEKKYTTDELKQLLEDKERPIYVAVEDSQVLGYAFCIFQHHGTHSMQTLKTLYIDDLCVSENIRGKHVGSLLYTHVLEIAKAAGCYNVTLNVWACNEAAMKFYQKCGLKVQKYGMETIL